MEYLKFSTFQQIFDDQIFMNNVTTSSGLIRIYFWVHKIFGSVQLSVWFIDHMLDYFWIQKL